MDQIKEKESHIEEKETLIQEKQDEQQEIELVVEQQNQIYQEIPFQVEYLDYWNLIYQGKFEIALLSDIDYSINSPNGFGLVHYLATFNNLEGLKLLANRNANLDVPSRQNQTALQIACSYGYIEICQLLIHHGCSLTQFDSYGCSALFYALKQKRYGLALYLMTLSELNGLTDQSGCSAVHWLSFNDDIFMLRFFNLLEYSYNLFDQQGRTPLGTACFNYSYNAINFFLEEQPIMFSYPYEQKSKSIEYKIQRMKAWRHLKARLPNNKIINKIIDNKQHLLVAAVLFLIFLNLIAFLISDCFQDYNDTFFGLILCFAYIIMLFYQAGYFIFFIRKTTDRQSEGSIMFRRPTKKQNEEQEIAQTKTELDNQFQYQNFNTNDDFQIPISKPIQQEEVIEEDKVRIEREIPRSSYDYGKTPRYLEGIKIKDFLQINYRPVEEFIDRLKIKPNFYFKFASQIGQHKEEIEQLIQIDDPLWYNSFTIIHFLYFFFTTNRFRAIHAIDWNRICPTCLQYKMPRTYHCKACKECVKDYHFHSYLFGKCINSTNHLFYFILILGSTVLVNVYLLFILTYYYNRSRSIYLLQIEVVNFLYESSLFEAFIYIINNIIAYYLNIQFLLEISLITFNMTYNEIFNSHRYRYLFEAYKISTGQVYLQWKTRFPKGLINNYLFYLVNSFKNMRIK